MTKIQKPIIIAVFNILLIIGILLYLLQSFSNLDKEIVQSKNILVEDGDLRRVDIIISDRQVNRISFAGKTIKTLISNLAEQHQNFITKDGENILITGNINKVMVLAVVLIDGQVVHLRIKSVKSADAKILTLQFIGNDKVPTKKPESLMMIDAMRRRLWGKYYIQKTNYQFLIWRHPTLKVTQVRKYEYGNIRGGEFKITNIGNNQIELVDADILTAFSNVVAMSIDNTIFLPKEEKRLFIVFAQ